MKKSTLKPVYLIHGDCPLLVQEARDAIKANAKKSGFIHTEFLMVEPGFDWMRLTALQKTRSLFSEQSVIDLRVPNGKFDDKAKSTLTTYFESPPDENILIISSLKLTKAQLNTKFFKSMNTVGHIETIWPINANALPGWIRQRMQQAKLHATPEAIQYLSDLTEGHLLATQQAIEKCTLLYPNTTIDMQKIASLLHDNARFTVFDLCNAALLGHQKRTLNIIDHLKFDGTEPVLILWALVKEIRSLITKLHQADQGTPITQLTQKEWASRKPLIQSALRRCKGLNMQHLLKLAADCDLIIKGIKAGDIWIKLRSIALMLAS